MTNPHADILIAIAKMETMLKDTKESAKYNRGPVNDVLQIVIPMMEDQLTIVKALAYVTGGGTDFTPAQIIEKSSPDATPGKI